MLNGYALRCMAAPPRCRGVSYVDATPGHQRLQKKRTVLMQAGPWPAPLHAGTIGTGLCGSLHLYPAPQHVVVLRTAAGRRLGAILAAPAGDLCTILHPNF